MSSSSETALYLEFELLSEIIKEIQAFIECNESNACNTGPYSILRRNNAYYSEINDAIYGNMIKGNSIGDQNELCDAAENYALKNLTKLEDAFKPKEEELAQFKTNFIRDPFFFNMASTFTSLPKNNDKDEDGNSMTLDDVKHLLPSFLVKELEFGTEVTCDTNSSIEADCNKSINSSKIEPIHHYKTITEYTSGGYNVNTMPVASPLRHPFFGYPAYMSSTPQMQQQQQQRFNQNFLYYPRSTIPPPGFSINELKRERQKKIEELMNRGKERQSILSLDDSLGVDVLKDDEQTIEGDDPE